MLFRYRGRRKETQKKKTFTTSDLKKNRFRLCTAITSLAIVFTIAATAANQFLQVALNQIPGDAMLENILVPLALHARQERLRLALTRDEMLHLQSGSEENRLMVVKPLRPNTKTQDPFYIRDLVVLPDELLVIVRLPSAKAKLGHKSLIRCVYSHHLVTGVNGIEYLRGRATVRCNQPREEWSASNVYILDTSTGRKIKQKNHLSQDSIKWDFLVYESLSTHTDVVIFAKGVNHRQGLNVNSESLRCVFNGTMDTAVTVSNQEVFRCLHPDKRYKSDLIGTKVSLRWRGGLVPSVAYYELPRAYSVSSRDREVLCACTMVCNVGKFLKEWVMYHSHLGVGQFFLYDNNSEDNLEETVGIGLREYNVIRRPWPWVKTQEAGFSHCALMARNRCRWMIYTDVDEFIFSSQWLALLDNDTQYRNIIGSRSKPAQIAEKTLESLVMETHNLRNLAGPVGQISIKCKNFGPSGLKRHPERGVTQGYTCREKNRQRHKSIVLLDALHPSLLNVIHHFELKEGYTTKYLDPSTAVINHYKYQAWSEFKSKFRRRVSAYVVDWKESRNPSSRDRTPGLGNRAVEPPEWENKFCDFNDTDLKDFTLRVFSSGSDMLWQL